MEKYETLNLIDTLIAIKKIKEDYLSGASPEMPDSYYLITDVDHFKEAIIANEEKCKEIIASSEPTGKKKRRK